MNTVLIKVLLSVKFEVIHSRFTRCFDDSASLVVFLYKKYKIICLEFEGNILSNLSRVDLKRLYFLIDYNTSLSLDALNMFDTSLVTEQDIFQLNILYPYRARPPQEFRKNELSKHMKVLEGYLVERGIDFKMRVLEQMDDLPFNKGRLLNVGFLEAMREFEGKGMGDKVPYFCIHNTDLFPIENVDYTFVNGIRDIHGYIGGVGGITLYDYLSYRQFKGYPNDFFGWGGEDIAVLNRILSCKISIDRSRYNNKNCKVEEIDHIRDSSRNMINVEKAMRDSDVKDTNNVYNTSYTITNTDVITSCAIHYFVV